MRQTCKVCGRPDKFNFNVPGQIWNAIVPASYQGRVVCLSCFDDFASAYTGPLAPFLHEIHFAGNRVSMNFAAQSAKDICG